MPKHLRNDVQRQEEIQAEKERQRRRNSMIILPKINKKTQIRERLMNWYQNDIPTMERKVLNYKHVIIPDDDPFVLFKILQLPNSNDLSEFCNRDDGRSSIGSRLSNRKSVRPISGKLIKDEVTA